MGLKRVVETVFRGGEEASPAAALATPELAYRVQVQALKGAANWFESGNNIEGWTRESIAKRLREMAAAAQKLADEEAAK